MTESEPIGVSAWKYAGIGALVSCFSLALGITLTADSATATAVAAVYFIPPVIIVAGSAFYIFRNQSGNPEFSRMMRGVILIAVVTGLCSGFFHTAWFRYFAPEVIESKLKLIAEQMIAEGYSDGDIKESIHRMRVAFTGLMGSFVSGLLWMMAGAFPSLFLVFLSRRT